MIYAVVNSQIRKARITHVHFSGLGSFFRHLSMSFDNTKVEYTKTCAPPISLLLLSDA